MNHSPGATERCPQSKNLLTSCLGWFQAAEPRRAWLVRVLFILMFTLLFTSTGCEVLTYERTDFPEAFVGTEGQDVILDDVMEIITDTGLDEPGKRQALHDLGIEDEDLIDALISG